MKNESGQMVKTSLPGLLAEVMGTTVEDYVPIYGAKQSVKFWECWRVGRQSVACGPMC